MYCSENFKSKKALKEAVKEYVDGIRKEPITIYQPGPFGGDPTKLNGKFCVEGPHFPEPHKWYAECFVEDGKILRVK